MLQIDNKFITQYNNLIYRTIRAANIKRQSTIDEIYSDVIIRLLKFNNYDPEKAPLEYWLKLVVRSVTGNYLKKHSHSEDALDQHIVNVYDILGKPDEGVQDSLPNLVDKTINLCELSDRRKGYLIDKYICGLSLREMAAKHHYTYEWMRRELKICDTELERRFEQSIGD